MVNMIETSSWKNFDSYKLNLNCNNEGEKFLKANIQKENDYISLWSLFL